MKLRGKMLVEKKVTAAPSTTVPKYPTENAEEQFL
jgi:hypothetical protein